jgi:hypothetical protein
VAATYDLGLPDLVPIVQDLDGLYAGGSALTIRDVPSRTVDQLVADLTRTAQLNMIGSQLSNFVAHGLRAPAADTSFTDLTRNRCSGVTRCCSATAAGQPCRMR